MRIGFALYDTEAQAEAVKVKLQARHDGRQGARIVDCVVQTWDGKFALTLLDGDESFDLEGGTFTESVEPPVMEELT